MANFLGQVAGNIADIAGTALGLPGIGLSEFLAGGSTVNTGRISEGVGPVTTVDKVDKGQYTYKETPGGGVQYFRDGVPISNAVYQSATGVNTSEIERNVKSSWDSRNANRNGGGNTEDNNTINTSGSYGYSTPSYTAADERAAYDDQISALQRLLGYTDTQKAAGLQSNADKYNYEKKTLDDQYNRALNDYAQKQDQNAQSKEKGLSEVDSFANSSFNNLKRLLQGGNAGNSSVARELMPYLVSKSATTRRTGVFDTAGQNDKSIADAKSDAEYQYGVNSQDLENNRKSTEQSFLETLLNKQNDLSSQMKDLQIRRAMANGSGYAAARASADSTQNSINDRQNQLASLFAQYRPAYTAKAMTTKTPELGTYTVDKAAISSSDRNLPVESSYYQTQLKKKQELGL